MWNPSRAGACMCRHVPVWSLCLHRHRFDCHGPLPVDSLVLFSDSPCHPEDAIHHREAEGLFHVCLSSHVCHPLLWHGQYNLPTAQIQVLTRHQEADVIGLHTAHPSAESTHLQPEEQGDEKGRGEIMGKKSDFTHSLTRRGPRCFSIMLLSSIWIFEGIENRVHFFWANNVSFLDSSMLEGISH